LAKTSGSRDIKQWLDLNSTTQNQLVSARLAENTSAVTTTTSTTRTTAAEGQNDDYDVDDIGFVDNRPRRKSRQMTLYDVGSLDHCDEETRAKIITNSICQFLDGTATAFTVVESSFFIDMIRSLNSAYLKFLPKSDAFRRTYLPALFQDTLKEIRKMWQLQGNPELTIGYDGHTNDNSNTVLIITETSEKLTAFKDCVDPKEDSESGEWIANTIMAQMEKVTEAEKSVETVYAGTVCDNVSCNSAASRLIEARYPKLFTPACCTHIADLLIEDICKIPAFKRIISDCRFLAVFIKKYRVMKNAYKRVIGNQNPKGTMLVLYPDTRFSYADLTLSQVEKNMNSLRILRDEAKFDNETIHAVPTSQKDRFVEIVDDRNFINTRLPTYC